MKMINRTRGRSYSLSWGFGRIYSRFISHYIHSRSWTSGFNWSGMGAGSWSKSYNRL